MKTIVVTLQPGENFIESLPEGGCLRWLSWHAEEPLSVQCEPLGIDIAATGFDALHQVKPMSGAPIAEDAAIIVQNVGASATELFIQFRYSTTPCPDPYPTSTSTSQ